MGPEHLVTRRSTGRVCNGNANQPYHIGYGSLVPKREQCANLLVPVCLSASHIAYGSARTGSAVQDVDYPSLRGLLDAQEQVLEID